MATNLSTCHPCDGIEALNRLPGFTGPRLQIDYERELQQPRREDSWQRETRRSSKTLAKYPDFRMVLILMKSGTRLDQPSFGPCSRSNGSFRPCSGGLRARARYPKELLVKCRLKVRLGEKRIDATPLGG